MEDLVQVLTKFHREVVLPDIKRVVGDLRDEMNARFTSLDGDFDAIYQRFDKLELKARVDVLQEQIHVLETRLGE